jgi:hypothetical protein
VDVADSAIVVVEIEAVEIEEVVEDLVVEAQNPMRRNGSP